MVDLIVGSEAKMFRVHRQLLCTSAPYFNKLLEGNFMESAKSHVEFPADNPIAFDFLIQWIYSSCLSHPVLLGGPITEAHINPVLLGVYLLADKLCIFRLQNQIIDLLLWSFRPRYLGGKGSSFAPSVCLWAYEHARANCALRRLLLDRLAFVSIIVAAAKTDMSEDRLYSAPSINETISGNAELKEDFVAAVEDFKLRFAGWQVRQHPEYLAALDPSRRHPPCWYHRHMSKSNCPRKTT
jgi:hypothetical protein